MTNDDLMRRIHPETWQAHFRRLGDVFGYPICCIDEVVSADSWDSTRAKRNFFGSGYVPCEKCNLAPVDDILRAITRRRKFPLPFPDQGDDMPLPKTYETRE